MATINPLKSLNPVSIVAGTGNYTVPTGYHGFLQASTSASASSAAGGHAAPSYTAYAGTTQNGPFTPQAAFTAYYGIGAGNGAASSSGATDFSQWVLSGATITPAAAVSGTTSADAYAQITIAGAVSTKSVAKGYALTNPVMIGSGLTTVAVGWSIALFLN